LIHKIIFSTNTASKDERAAKWFVAVWEEKKGEERGGGDGGRERERKGRG
jgi:hypothetical protein